MSGILRDPHQAYARAKIAGEPPNVLYLGSTDWLEFAKAVEKSPNTVYNPALEGRRPQYLGCGVYLVNADSHLHFSHL